MSNTFKCYVCKEICKTAFLDTSGTEDVCMGCAADVYSICFNEYKKKKCNSCYEDNWMLPENNFCDPCKDKEVLNKKYILTK